MPWRPLARDAHDGDVVEDRILLRACIVDLIVPRIVGAGSNSPYSDQESLAYSACEFGTYFGLSSFIISQNGAAKADIRLSVTNHGSGFSTQKPFTFAAMLSFSRRRHRLDD